MLVLYSAQIGVFVAQDLLLFFIIWEVELIPVYLLVCIWGGQNRRYAATKFLIYTAAASIFILVAALGMAFYGDGNLTFDIVELGMKDYPLGLELLLYAGLLIAFGVKLAIFPLHTCCKQGKNFRHYLTKTAHIFQCHRVGAVVGNAC